MERNSEWGSNRSSVSPALQENIPLQSLRKLDSMEESDPLYRNTLREHDEDDEDDDEDDFESDQEIDGMFPFAQPSLKDRIGNVFRLIVNGPSQPRDEAPTAIAHLEYIESIPAKFRKTLLHKTRVAVLIAYLAMWLFLAYHTLVSYLTVPPSYGGDDSVAILTLSCGSDLLFWKGKNQRCGLNGEGCPALADIDDVIIRCPALCERESYTFSFLPVGDQNIKYRGYYIGGGQYQQSQKQFPNQVSNPYRADSFPCGAAVHAGVVSSYVGGCARVSFGSKGRGSFPETKAHAKGKPSVSFNSFFPSSFFFKSLNLPENGNYHFHQCKDPRFVVLAINILLGIPIVFMASGAVMFWTMSIVGFWTICMATDPPVVVEAINPETLADLVSLGLGRFLPTCCILYVLWRCSVKTTLGPVSDNSDSEDFDPKSESPLQRLFLWYPVFWVGILNNLTFDRLPLDRFTWSDLKLQPGSMAAGLSIVGVVTVSLAIQAYHVWRSGKLIKVLSVYICFIIGLVVIANLPGLTLRIHHYILAMLLIPGCATRGRTALVFQGLLLGLFISGASRWGLASIAETTRVLLREDPIGIIEPPLVSGFDPLTGLLSWTNSSTPATVEYQNYYDGVSLMVNDIEAYVGINEGGLNLTALLTQDTFFSPLVQLSLNDSKALDSNGDVLVYLRLALKIIDGDAILAARAIGLPIWSDFSRAAVLKWPSGVFSSSPPGLTK